MLDRFRQKDTEEINLADADISLLDSYAEFNDLMKKYLVSSVVIASFLAGYSVNELINSGFDPEVALRGFAVSAAAPIASLSFILYKLTELTKFEEKVWAARRLRDEKAHQKKLIANFLARVIADKLRKNIDQMV